MSGRLRGRGESLHGGTELHHGLGGVLTDALRQVRIDGLHAVGKLLEGIVGASQFVGAQDQPRCGLVALQTRHAILAGLAHKRLQQQSKQVVEGAADLSAHERVVGHELAVGGVGAAACRVDLAAEPLHALPFLGGLLPQPCGAWLHIVVDALLEHGQVARHRIVDGFGARPALIDVAHDAAVGGQSRLQPLHRGGRLIHGRTPGFAILHDHVACRQEVCLQRRALGPEVGHHALLDRLAQFVDLVGQQAHPCSQTRAQQRHGTACGTAGDQHRSFGQFVARHGGNAALFHRIIKTRLKDHQLHIASQHRAGAGDLGVVIQVDARVDLEGDERAARRGGGALQGGGRRSLRRNLARIDRDHLAPLDATERDGCAGLNPGDIL